MARRFYREVKAFTLLEIMVVVLIMSFLFAISMPRMRTTMQSGQLRVYTRDIISLLKYARAEAVTKRKWVEIRFDLDQHGYQLDLLLQGVPLNYREDEDVEVDPLEEMKFLPKEISFTSIVTYDDRIEEEDDSIVVIRFYPSGKASNATIVLQSDGSVSGNTAYMTIELFATTGAVETFRGKPDEEDIYQVEFDDIDYPGNYY